jgi:hypothetical protein
MEEEVREMAYHLHVCFASTHLSTRQFALSHPERIVAKVVEELGLGPLGTNTARASVLYSGLEWIDANVPSRLCGVGHSSYW